MNISILYDPETQTQDIADVYECLRMIRNKEADFSHFAEIDTLKSGEVLTGYYFYKRINGRSTLV